MHSVADGESFEQKGVSPASIDEVDTESVKEWICPKTVKSVVERKLLLMVRKKFEREMAALYIYKRLKFGGPVWEEMLVSTWQAAL